MKKTFVSIIIILIVFSAGYLSHNLLDDGSAPGNTVIVTIPGDTVFQDSVIEVPVVYTKDTTIYDSIIKWKEVDVDTPGILRDYFTQRYYKDTFNYFEDTSVIDTSMIVIVEDSVYANKIQYRRLYAKNLRETEIIKNITVDNKGFYIGTNVSLRGFYLNGSYLYKKNNFEIGTGFTNFDDNIKPTIYIGYKRKLENLW